MNINLDKFCGTHDRREWMRQTFVCSEHEIATNGHVLVAVANKSGCLDTEIYLTHVRGILKKSIAASQTSINWIAVSSIALPDGVACMRCNGKCIEIFKKCDDCDGDGYFEHGNHTYYCKECDGDGKVVIQQNALGFQEKIICLDCKGSGEQITPVAVGSTHIQKWYLTLLLGLPKCEIQLHENFAYIRFDGGIGIVMSIDA